MHVWESLQALTLISWQARHVDNLTNVKLQALRLVRSWILNRLLCQESIQVRLLRLLTLENISQHGHKMLLGLHVIRLVTVIVAREGKLHHDFNVIVPLLCLWLLFKLKQIVYWMVKEDISLNDFMALDIELVLRESFDSIVVKCLAFHDQG